MRRLFFVSSLMLGGEDKDGQESDITKAKDRKAAIMYILQTQTLVQIILNKMTVYSATTKACFAPAEISSLENFTAASRFEYLPTLTLKKTPLKSLNLVICACLYLAASLCLNFAALFLSFSAYIDTI